MRAIVIVMLLLPMAARVPALRQEHAPEADPLGVDAVLHALRGRPRVGLVLAGPSPAPRAR